MERDAPIAEYRRHQSPEVSLLAATATEPSQEAAVLPGTRTPRSTVETALPVVQAKGRVLQAENVTFQEPIAIALNVRRPAPDVGLREGERELILAALRKHGGSQRAAAKALKIPRTTLQDMMRRLGIERP